MVSFKVYTNELNRVIKSVKKGVAKKATDELKGIRFQIVENDLVALTTDGYKVFTNRCSILEKTTEIPEDFEYISPVIKIPADCDDVVTITIDFETNKIEYNFKTSVQIYTMYYLNSDMVVIKKALETIPKQKNLTEIIFDAENLKKALDGFDRKDNIKLSIKSSDSMILISSETDEKNKRLVMPCC